MEVPDICKGMRSTCSDVIIMAGDFTFIIISITDFDSCDWIQIMPAHRPRLNVGSERAMKL